MMIRRRICNAWSALRGLDERRAIPLGSTSIEITADVAPLEADLERAKAKLKEFEDMRRSATTPTLLLLAKGNLSKDSKDRIREQIEAAFREGKHLVLDSGISVFQLVDGRYDFLPGPYESLT